MSGSRGKPRLFARDLEGLLGGLISMLVLKLIGKEKNKVSEFSQILDIDLRFEINLQSLVDSSTILVSRN